MIDTVIEPSTIIYTENGGNNGGSGGAAATSARISLSTWSVINQDTALSVQALPEFNYDYELILSSSDVNALFKDRIYQQNGADPNRYDVTLTINADTLWNYASDASKTTMTPESSAITSLGVMSTGQKVGLRLLEIVAIKVFGHAKARAAIANDSEFYQRSVYDALSNSMNASLLVDRNTIFSQYVNLDRVEHTANDVNGYNDVEAGFPFNFANLDMVFPVYLQGSLSGSGSADLLNGPNVGGARLANGTYNVPIKMTFKTSA